MFASLRRGLSGIPSALFLSVLILTFVVPALADNTLSQGDMDRLSAAVLNAARATGEAPPARVVQSRVLAVAEALRTNPGAPSGSGVLHTLRQGDPRAAIDLLTGELDTRARKHENPEGAQAARVLLQLARLTEDAPLERRAAEAATRHAPDNLADFGELARVLVQQGDLAAAENAWQYVLRRTSGDGEARYTALVPLLQLLEQRARALKAHQEKGDGDNPYELAARMNDLAKIYADVLEKTLAQGMYYRAAQVLETTRDRQAVGQQWEIIARFHERFGDPARAVATYQQAIALFEAAGETERARQLRDWLREKYHMP
ncbi:MAG: hypothetical protein OEW11_04250 [Nitrospirota bacterium]|nr:hypothetical protein [Nitrospirota bacterium]